MKRFGLIFTLVLVAVVMILPLTGCKSGCNGDATMTLRNPFLIDHEQPTMAGERMRIVQQPMILAPSWQAIQAPQPAYCAPAVTAPCYTAPAATYNPCGPAAPTGGQGTGAPDSIPAVRR